MKRDTNRISVITLGCSKNTVDSERLMQQLKFNKFRVSENPENADTVIINTCGFIDAAKEESVNTILNAVALKQQGRIKKIVVAGCLSERYAHDLAKEIPEVDAYFGTENYSGIIGALGGSLKTELLGERLLSTPPHTAYLKISEGCDHPCSFCAIPLMRGQHVSKPSADLIKEAELLSSKGVKELVIIAQDTTDYGKDLNGKQTISGLLSRLSEINGIEWIRLMYAYPSRFPDDLIHVMAGNEKICKYIDLPLQHISNTVLKSMRRGVTSERTKDLIYRLRENIPGLVLRTTFITGYPNEGDKEFEELYNFIKEIKFDRLGIFNYSREENTSSFILGDPVANKIKEERRDILMNLQKEISLEINEGLINKRLNILVEKKEGDYYIGRSYRDAPEVDGEVLIEAHNLNLRKGHFYPFVVYDFNEYDLYAGPESVKRK